MKEVDDMTVRVGFWLPCIAVALSLLSPVLFAQKKVPTVIQVQGRLVDENANITTAQKLTIKVIEGGSATQTVSGGKVLYAETVNVTPDPFGFYAVTIGDDPDAGQSKLKPAVFTNAAKLFIEVSRHVNGKPKVMLPRQTVTSVAYSLFSQQSISADEALHAVEADHAAKSDQALDAVKSERAMHADKATTADRAVTADRASIADKATTAENAKRAESAATADKAQSAEQATKAQVADKALSADRAEQATNAQTAGRATLADKAMKADESIKAGTAEKSLFAEKAAVADRAIKTESADRAETAQQAVKAQMADKATSADHATRADEAIKAQTAVQAERAQVAEKALQTESSVKADEAKNAATADRATRALSADKAVHADNATNADNASAANYANEAAVSQLATQAKRAARADTALNALRLGGIDAEEFATRPLQKTDFGPGVVLGNSIAQNSITSNHIRDGAISGMKIAKGAITGDLIRDGSIPPSKMMPIAAARKLKSAPPPLDSVDVTGNLSVSGNLFHRFGTIYTPLIRSDGYIFSRFMSAEGILFALKGSVSGNNGTAVEGNVQSEIGSAFLASGFGDMFRGQRIPQFSGDPVIYRISNRGDVEIRNTANDPVYTFTADSARPVLTIGGPASSGSIVLRGYSGNESIKLSCGDSTQTPQLSIDGSIIVQGKELRVRDYAEVFELANKEALIPGQVVVIDPDSPGQLKLASRAYDRSVAGVISGGDASSPGIMLGTRHDGSTDKPVALAGRVYCYADASFGAIHAGDLLTTSATAGHAMKVTDYTSAQGAIIGKAMESLPSGKGRILILVTLQ